MNAGIYGARGWRWWSWQGPAHAVRYGGRGTAICGERLDPPACYAYGSVPRCPRCLVLTGDDPLAALASVQPVAGPPVATEAPGTEAPAKSEVSDD